MRWQVKWLFLLVLMLISLSGFSAQSFSRATILKDLNLSDMIVTVENGDSYQLDVALVSYLYELKRQNALTLRPGMAVQMHGEVTLSQGTALKGTVHQITPVDSDYSR
jgi:hypothetical protein